jgi:hypothetical protein
VLRKRHVIVGGVALKTGTYSQRAGLSSPSSNQASEENSGSAQSGYLALVDPTLLASQVSQPI